MACDGRTRRRGHRGVMNVRRRWHVVSGESREVLSSTQVGVDTVRIGCRRRRRCWRACDERRRRRGRRLKRSSCVFCVIRRRAGRGLGLSRDHGRRQRHRHRRLFRRGCLFRIEFLRFCLLALLGRRLFSLAACFFLLVLGFFVKVGLYLCFDGCRRVCARHGMVPHSKSFREIGLPVAVFASRFLCDDC